MPFDTIGGGFKVDLTAYLLKRPGPQLSAAMLGTAEIWLTSTSVYSKNFLRIPGHEYSG